MERLAKSKCCSEDDCSLKLILILKFDPRILAICSFNVFQCSRTNCSFRNPGFVEYDNLDAILFPNRQRYIALPQSLAGDARSSNRRRRQHRQIRRCRSNGKHPNLHQSLAYTVIQKIKYRFSIQYSSLVRTQVPDILMEFNTH